MLKVRVIEGKAPSELEMAVNKAIAEIEGCFTKVTNVEMFQEGKGITAVIHYDTEYYTI